MTADRGTPSLQFFACRSYLLSLEVLEGLEDVDLTLTQLVEVVVPESVEVLNLASMGHTHCPLLPSLLTGHASYTLLLFLRTGPGDVVMHLFRLTQSSLPHALQLPGLEQVPEWGECYSFSEKDRVGE
jgi:hypothetical protein